MKKILLSIALLVCISGYGYAVGGYHGTYAIEVTGTPDTITPDDTVGAGDVYIQDNLEVDGACNFDGNINVAGTITSANGFVNVTDVFDDVPATNETGHFAFVITTTTLVAGTTTIIGSAITDPIIPMNVVVFSSAAATVQAALDLAGTLTIVGYDARGEAQTETIAISSTSTAGVCAWADFTSFSLSGVTVTTAAGDAMINIGVGTILGLSNHIATSGLLGAGGDVIWAQLNDSGTTSADNGTCNTTYNTWTPDTAGDGTADVYTIRYKVKVK